MSFSSDGAYSVLAFLLDVSGPAAVFFLFAVLHLLSAPLARGRVPVLWLLTARAAQELARRLSRPSCTLGELRGRGVFFLAATMACAALIGLAVISVTRFPFGWLAVVFLLWGSVSVLGPVRILQGLGAGRGPVDLAAQTVSLRPLHGDALDAADRHMVARRGLEAFAVWLNLHLVMPLFWLVLAGPVGVVLAVMVSAAAAGAETGADPERSGAFMSFLRGACAVFETVPALITAALIAVAALFVSRANPLRATAVALRQARGYRPFRQGVVIAALAGALHVTLGGARRLRNGATVRQDWVGPPHASARVDAESMKRAAFLGIVVYLLVLAIVAGILPRWS